MAGAPLRSGGRPPTSLPEAVPPRDPCNNGNITPYPASPAHGRLPLGGYSTPPPWHIDAVGGRPPSRWIHATRSLYCTKEWSRPHYASNIVSLTSTATPNREVLSAPA